MKGSTGVYDPVYNGGSAYEGTGKRNGKTIGESEVSLKVFDWYFKQSPRFSLGGLPASLTCRHFGIHRSYFYRWKGRYNKWKRWRGYRLMAIDSSFIQLPSDPALLKHFGGPGPAQTAATALGSLLYDLLNDIIVDAKIAPVSANERSLAKEHLEVLTGLEAIKRVGN